MVIEQPKIGPVNLPSNLSKNTSRHVKATGGVEGSKTCGVILKDLIELRKMLKTASKHIVPNSSYDFLKIAIRL